MNRLLILSVFISLLSVSCTEEPHLSDAVLIPKPVSVTSGSGSFSFTKASVIRISTGSPELEPVGRYFADKIKPATGFQLKVEQGGPSSGNLYLALSDKDPASADEGYVLVIADTSVSLVAHSAAGIFRGMQTIIQLLPDAIEQSSLQNDDWKLPSGTINDYPGYAFRGAMLDVSRHFFTVEEVKHYIDLIAAYKLNVLHLHLSDDQGWRIEIKSWPRLTAYGGSSEVGGGKGGYYTQEQYKDLVKYAQARYITIIPEIDMPGHTNAALASYAELNCNDSATALYTKTEVGFSTFCVKKDITYKFADDVVRELAAITPGPYIHLGGDESHATKKEDYILFINKIKDIPGKYGKQMIGWEETAQASLDSGSIVQYWADTNYAIEAVKKGAKIIMSPATKVYLDMKYDSTTRIGLEWAARIELDSSYNWSLSGLVKGIPKASILGIEAPLWTETILNMDDIEYMVFPRLIGVAEIGWSPEKGKSWEEYKVRLGKHATRLKALGINYHESKLVPWTAH